MNHFVRFTYICDLADVWRPPTSFFRTTPVFQSLISLVVDLCVPSVGLDVPDTLLLCDYPLFLFLHPFIHPFVHYRLQRHARRESLQMVSGQLFTDTTAQNP